MLMSGAAHLESALQRHAEHRHIADKVQYLMADKFIGKTQSFGVDDAFVADNDGVGEGTAQSQILLCRYSTSFIKPNVLADATSSKVSGVISRAKRWTPIALWGKSMV